MRGGAEEEERKSENNILPNSVRLLRDIVSRCRAVTRGTLEAWLSRPGEFLNLLVSQEGSEPTSEALPQECD